MNFIINFFLIPDLDFEKKNWIKCQMLITLYTHKNIQKYYYIWYQGLLNARCTASSILIINKKICFRCVELQCTYLLIFINIYSKFNEWSQPCITFTCFQFYNILFWKNLDSILWLEFSRKLSLNSFREIKQKLIWVNTKFENLPPLEHQSSSM